MKYFSITFIIIFITILTLTTCKKESSTTDVISEVKDETSKVTTSFMSENFPQDIIIVKNPNIMRIETTPRDLAKVSSEKKAIEEYAEKIIEHIDEHGLEAALQEVNKGKEGTYKQYLPDIDFYLLILKRTANGTMKIIAHNLPVAIGADLDENITGIAGWKFFIVSREAGSNRVWLENLYWKSTTWADGKVARMNDYDRHFKLNGEDYTFMYNQWVDE